jgi:transporter family-2 protein
MLVAGGLVAVQSRINGGLAEELGTGTRAGFAAAAISFGTGLVLVAALTAVIPSGRHGLRRIRVALAAGQLSRRLLLGGALGGFLVATQGIAVPTVGVALFSVGMTAGMSANALAVDHFGLGPSGKSAMSAPRIVAAVFTVTAVFLAAGERLAGTFTWSTVILVVLPVLAGAGSAVQQAVNGRVSAFGGPWATTLNNFAVGLGALLVCLAASLLADGHLGPLPHTWWLYLGGSIGVVFIWLSSVLVKVHGVLVLSLAMIAGQVTAAELIELLSPDAHIGVAGVLAGVLTLVGVLIAVLLRPRGTVSHI